MYILPFYFLFFFNLSRFPFSFTIFPCLISPYFHIPRVAEADNPPKEGEGELHIFQTNPVIRF